MARTSWERTREGVTYYVSVEPTQVVVGEHRGSGHTDNAGTCSHAEFVGGRWHDHIRTNMGARTLSEILAALASAP